MIPKTVPIVLSCDSTYSMPLAVTLLSLIEANVASLPLEVFILSANFGKRERLRVEASLPDNAATLCWIDIDLKEFRLFSVTDHVSRMTYARLLVARALPNRVEKVLYLDADILVFKDISSLLDMDLEGAVVGAVKDTIAPLLERGDARLDAVPKVRSYFNAGVLIIDLQKWRSEEVSEKALGYLLSNPATPYWDQDALNVACDGKWKELPRTWNHQTHTSLDLAALTPEERPAIVHFVTSSKPWDPRRYSVNAKFYDLYRARTRFARTWHAAITEKILRFYANVRSEVKRMSRIRLFSIRRHHVASKCEVVP